MRTRVQRRLLRWLASTALLAAAATASASGDAPAVVALVIDSSGSLTKADLEKTRALAAGILESLPATSEVAVFSFDDQSRLLLPRSSNPEDVRRALEVVAIAGRYTALNDALYDASRYLRDAPPARKAIVLVTDGKDENSALNLDDALKVAQETPIRVFAVGVGKVEERVLRRIAKLTGGEYMPAAEATGSLVASRITADPDAAADGVSAAAPATTFPPPATGGAAASGARRAAGRLWVYAAFGVGTVVALAVLGLRALSRRPRCATCGRKLAGPLSSCAFCPPDAAASTTLGRHEDGMSATVLARMDLTEEYLEKTVTLREDPVLTITSGPGSGMIFSLNRQSATSLGRAKANDIVLEDVSVSSQHCRIRPEDGRFLLHDLKSTNGTFVNEHRVTSHTLAEGDVIKLGETYLQFRLNQKRT